MLRVNSLGDLRIGESLPLSRSRCVVSGYPIYGALPRNAPGSGAGLVTRSVPQALRPCS